MGSPGGLGHPCSACKGDCDVDTDCQGNLVCMQRSGAEPIPGCTGTAVGGYDYCYDPSAADDSMNCLTSKCCAKVTDKCFLQKEGGSAMCLESCPDGWDCTVLGEGKKSMQDAEATCTKLGNRVCTKEEVQARYANAVETAKVLNASLATEDITIRGWVRGDSKAACVAEASTKSPGPGAKYEFSFDCNRTSPLTPSDFDFCCSETLQYDAYYNVKPSGQSSRKGFAPTCLSS